MSAMTNLISGLADYAPMLMRKPAPKFVSQNGNRIYGIVAEFSETPAVYKAAQVVRDAGYSKWDVHSPFPVHGMEEAMGMKTTKLPLIAGGAAVTGVLFAIFLQWVTSGVLYPMVTQGKPYAAWEPFLPITFELGVLFTAFACLFGMLALNGLPRFHHPLFGHERFYRTSNDRFIIAIEAADANFDPDNTRSLLEQAGGDHITIIEEED
ncbi:MAG: DUF3341 domain-containing protein [Planctomycetota bacterium]